jgi:hypothetical protein
MACTAVARPKPKAATAINLIIVFSYLSRARKDSLKRVILFSFNSVVVDAGQKLDGRMQMLAVNAASRGQSVFSLAAKTVESVLVAPRKKDAQPLQGWTPERVHFAPRREGKPARTGHIFR